MKMSYDSGLQYVDVRHEQQNIADEVKVGKFGKIESIVTEGVTFDAVGRVEKVQGHHEEWRKRWTCWEHGDGWSKNGEVCNVADPQQHREEWSNSWAC